MASFAAALAASILIPTVALGAVGGVVDDVLGGGDRAGVPGVGSGYQPPLHTGDPHGQGSVLSVDIGPSQQLPLPNGDPAAGDEEIVVGDSRGEYSGGAYHGRVTILRALIPIANIDIDIAFRTEEGQTSTGLPLPLQAVLLNDLCTNTTVCLTVLGVNSTTSSSGSQNSFETANADIGNGAIQLGLLSSRGDISDDGTCQTATGSSSWLDLDVLGVITADALQGSSSSSSCNTGGKTQSNDSELLNVNGLGAPILPAGCNNGTPDTEIVPPAPISNLIVAVCHADDSNGVGEAGVQATEPYGVREALTVFLLGGIAKIAVSGPESKAEAPPAQGAAHETEGGRNRPDGPGDPGPAEPGASAAGEAVAGDGDTLPFTGSNLLLLALVGGLMLIAGAAVSSLSGHRRPPKQL